MSIFDFFDFVIKIVSDLGYFGVFLGVFLEGVFPPIPSEIIMSLSGFLISTGRFSWLATILVATAANALSVSFIWYLGKTFGRGFLIRWGKWIGVNEKEIQTGETLFNKYGYGIVLVCQMIPIARTTIAFPAGVLKTEYLKFIFFNTLGASVWLTVLTIVGYSLGENWAQIENIFKPYERAILVLLIILTVYLAIKWLLHIRTLLTEQKTGTKG